MRPELGGSQITALLEAVPGIVNVLRSPVADALVKAIRAGAGLAELQMDDVQELVQYAVRRGLVGPEEGERLMEEVGQALRPKKSAKRGKGAKKARPKKKTPARKAARPKKGRVATRGPRR